MALVSLSSYAVILNGFGTEQQWRVVQINEYMVQYSYAIILIKCTIEHQKGLLGSTDEISLDIYHLDI